MWVEMPELFQMLLYPSVYPKTTNASLALKDHPEVLGTHLSSRDLCHSNECVNLEYRKEIPSVLCKKQVLRHLERVHSNGQRNNRFLSEMSLQ